MIKVEVIRPFTLERYKELENVNKKQTNEANLFSVGDTFECSKEIADYLLGNNKLQQEFIKILEVIPVIEKSNVKEAIDRIKESAEETVKPLSEERVKKVKKEIEKHVEMKPKKTTKKKTDSK